ncbi:Ribonuclease 3 [Natranaerofaba carboxydovora]|nr:Ribonuclease 3 [Natranaerofaba carboxydovora]
MVVNPWGESMEKTIKELIEKLGVKTENLDLFLQAVTHTSYAHEKKHNNISHNERLEFLGDAVLELITSEILYFRYPNLPEGELTKLRASIVCEESLLKVAHKLELGKYLRLGRGEEASGGRERASILADSVEAVFGALYLDVGYERTKNIVHNLMNELYEDIDRDRSISDYKTTLQELTQKNFDSCPIYRIVEEYGPDHDKKFVAQVEVDGNVFAKGKGKSKKEAEQRAAKIAWEKLK